MLSLLYTLKKPKYSDEKRPLNMNVTSVDDFENE